MIKYQTYSVGSVILLKSVIAAYINSFWLDVFRNFKANGYLRIIFKVKFADNSLGYRTIAAPPRLRPGSAQAPPRLRPGSAQAPPVN
jgi:hypothetical protein